VNEVTTTELQKLHKIPGILGLPSKESAADADWCRQLGARRQKTLLLVDDEEAIRHIGQELLEDMGYKVLLAKDGKEAVVIYEKKRDEIDIVLLDIMMPNMGGSEAYDRLKAMNPKVKVLLWSGANVDGLAADMLKRGCNGFIHKPFSVKKLRTTIIEILDEA
jgi:CheY-like chemotaxis protein